MPLNMKCNITIDYTIAVVPDVNEFNRVFSKTKLMLLFSIFKFLQIFLFRSTVHFLLDFKFEGMFLKKVLFFFRAFLFRCYFFFCFFVCSFEGEIFSMLMF